MANANAAKQEETIKAPSVLTLDIPLDHLVIDEDFNARKNYGGDGGDIHATAQSLEELAKDMKNRGQDTPISVSNIKGKEGRYFVVAGHRRVLAAKALGWSNIRAEVKSYDDEQALYVANVAENVARKALGPYELADRFYLFGKKFKLEPIDISRKLGFNRKYVANMVRLREKLHPEILKAWKERNPLCAIPNLLKWVSLEKPEQLETFKVAKGELAPSGEGAGSDGEGEGGGAGAKKDRARNIDSLKLALTMAEDYASKAKGEERARAKGAVDALKFACQMSDEIAGVYKPEPKPVKEKKGKKLPPEAEEALLAQEIAEGKTA